MGLVCSSFRALLAVTAGVTLSASAAAAPVFRILPYEVPEGTKSCSPETVTNDGTVTGLCRLSSGPPRDVNVKWSPDGAIELLPFQDPYVIARNDKNQAVAVTLEPYGNYIYGAPGQAPVDFLKGTWAERGDSILGINAKGHVLGNSFLDGCCIPTPWLWSKARGLSHPIEPPLATYFFATRLNNRDEISGTVSAECTSRAAIYDARAKRLRYVGPGGLPKDRTCGMFSQATALNDVGQVIGTVDWTFDAESNAAYLWTDADGPVRLAGNSDDENARGYHPISINNRGQVVGSFTQFRPVLGAVRIFYWDKDTPATNLADLIDPADPLRDQVELLETNYLGRTVITVPAILENGEIVVRGLLTPRRPSQKPDRFFRLVPVSPAK